MKSFKLWMLAAIILAGSVSVFAQTNVNEEQGMKPYDSWHGGDLDSISMTNGGVVHHIPLAAYPQRGNLDFSFSVLANTKQWQAKADPGCPNNPGAGCPASQYWRAMGVSGANVVSSLDWSPGYECSVETGNEENWWTPTYTWSGSVSAPDGSVHQFGSGSSPTNCPAPPFRALDASGIFQPDGNNIIMPNGTRFTYDTYGLLNSVTDTNGNRITMDISTGRYTDTIGRVIALPPNTYSAASDLSNCPSGTAIAKAWSVPGLSGGTRTFKFCYSNISIYTSFGQQGITEAAPTNTSLLTAIVLPDLTLLPWTFSYDHYGDLTRLGFPTGGSISYTYAMGPQTCGSGTPVSMAVTSRTVDANDGTGGHTWRYTYSGQYSGSYSGTTIVTSPDGNDTVHTITNPVAGAPCSFYDTQVQYYQGSRTGGTLLKTAATQYSGIVNPLSGDTPTAANVVPTQATVTWPDGHSSKVVNTWDSGNSVSPYGTAVPVILGSVLQKDEYDFSNTLVRSTLNHYLWQDNATYKSNNFLELVTSSTVKNGASQQVAQSTTAFDQTAVTSSGITTQRVAPPAGGNIRGNATTASHWLNTTNSFISSTATYFDTGMKASSTDPLSHATSYTYSSTFAGAYATQTNLPDTQNYSGAPLMHHIVNGNYDFNTGLLTSFTDENSQNFTYTYDNMLRLTQGNHPDGGKTIFTYPDPLTVTRQHLVTTGVYDSLTGKFDGLGRPIQTQHATPDCASKIKVDTTYDVAGRAATASNPYCLTTEPTYGLTQSQYDALGRATKITKQDGSSSTVSYTGNCTTATDEAGKARKSCSDALGRLTNVWEDPAGLNYETDYQYDTLGNLLRVDQKGSAPTDSTKWRTRLFTYNSLSQLLTANNPESGTISYSYDVDGNMISKISPAANQTGAATITVNYTYDALHRLTRKNYSYGFADDPVSV